MCDLTVIILTYNEEMHIERCIRSVRGIAEKIIVVDSFSTDSTIQIAKREGVEIHQHVFINQADQFNWALGSLGIKTEWVMRLDADEYPEAELLDEITLRLPLIDRDISGINLKRRHIFMGRWIKHGTRYPLIMLRIWRNGQAYVESRWMDEHVVLKSGNSITFKHDFSDHNLRDISWWIDKHNNYASREAVDVLKRKYSLDEKKNEVSAGSTNKQMALKRVVKENAYSSLPIFLGPLLYFLYRYFIRLGFLDRKEGAAYHFLQGFWYRFLVDVKVFEVEKHMKKNNVSCVEAIRSELSMDPFF